MSCKWNGRDQPRVITARHEGDCTSSICAGCLECTDQHCRVCGSAHAHGTCPECLAITRDELHRIGTMCDALPEEVAHRGIQGEAMVLLGPAADPEARGHLEASVLAGRVPVDYLDIADGERHPLFVLGTHLMTWQDALEHEDDTQVTVETAIGYLDRQLTYMSGYDHVPFEEFVKDVRSCLRHLQSVLHDQNQGDRANVGCFNCGGDLERILGKAGFEDVWTCGQCRRKYTPAEYNFALRAKLEQASALEATA